jgi:hypothetical protein
VREEDEAEKEWEIEEAGEEKELLKRIGRRE